MPTVEEIKKIIIPLAESYQLKNAKLFGSYARGEQTDQSDVDLLVELGQPMGYFRFNGLQLDLEELLGCSVDLCTPKSLDPVVAAAIQNDLVTVYDRA